MTCQSQSIFQPEFCVEDTAVIKTAAKNTFLLIFILTFPFVLDGQHQHAI